MRKGPAEGEEAEDLEERRPGMTLAKETEMEAGRREKVQREEEEEVGVLREAEQVGRQRKVSVCLLGHSSTGLCLWVFLYHHQSDMVSHDASWLPSSHHSSCPRLQTEKSETNY